MSFTQKYDYAPAMIFNGKLIGGALGLIIGWFAGGLGGAPVIIGIAAGIIGIGIGHYLFDRPAALSPSGKQAMFTAGVIALGAKLAKADGVVTDDEVEAFREVFKSAPGDMKYVARVFNLAKQDVAGYDLYADQIADAFKDDRDLMQDLMDGLFHIAAADGIIHPLEVKFLQDVSNKFGFTETEFKYILARHVPSDARSPYDVLGITPDISDGDLKTRYRKMVVENHPDRLIARGVPEEFIKIATDKLAVINDAYSEIAQERGL